VAGGTFGGPVGSPGGGGRGGDSGAPGPASPSGDSGLVNTGGGGGGGGCYSQASPFLNNAGGSGGSGIVIIRYPDTFGVIPATGGYTLANTGGYRVYSFTGSGTLTMMEY
jgi:hypothetical protein